MRIIINVKFLEVSAWILGLALLIYYNISVAAQADKHAEGIEQFNKLKDSPKSYSSYLDIKEKYPFPVLKQPKPDFSTWSESAKGDYQKYLNDEAVPVALLSIAQLDLNVPIYNGATEEVLAKGAGRVGYTANFDEIGNIGVAGHRDSWFRALKDIEIGHKLKIGINRLGRSVRQSVNKIGKKVASSLSNSKVVASFPLPIP